jgi:DNA polymerase sigma
LKNELSRVKEESINKDKYISKLSSDWAQKESELLSRLDELQNKLKEESSNYQNLAKDYESLEKKFSEHAKECSLKIHEDKLSKLDIHLNKKEYLEKKFSGMKYDEKYIIKCLQKDILDFQDYTKEQIKKSKSIQEEIIKLIQEAVNDCMPDYEVRLYGSHATNLCLQWSDLDIVLIHKKNFNATNYNALQSLYLNLLVCFF